MKEGGRGRSGSAIGVRHSGDGGGDNVGVGVGVGVRVGIEAGDGVWRMGGDGDCGAGEEGTMSRRGEIGVEASLEMFNLPCARSLRKGQRRTPWRRSTFEMVGRDTPSRCAASATGRWNRR